MSVKRWIVVGTPVTPKSLLPTLAGGSFCVSHAAPRDLERCIELVGADEILVLDNGAFTHWRQGKGAIDRARFWNWANDAQARSPQAIAVIPDVIEGSERDNEREVGLALEGLAAYPHRTMAIWHLNESLELLERLCRTVNFVGFGSCAEFDVQRQRAAYLARIAEASAVVDQVELEENRRPWIHLMRGLGVFGELCRFESADSTNIAVNHHRYRAEHGPERAAYMLRRITDQVLAGIARVGLEPVRSAITNFAEPATWRPCLPGAGHQGELFIPNRLDVLKLASAQPIPA